MPVSSYLLHNVSSTCFCCCLFLLLCHRWISWDLQLLLLFPTTSPCQPCSDRVSELCVTARSAGRQEHSCHCRTVCKGSGKGCALIPTSSIQSSGPFPISVVFQSC